MSTVTMISSCCVCHRSKVNGQWVYREVQQGDAVTHGMCPGCFSQAMLKLDETLGELRKRVPGHDL